MSKLKLTGTELALEQAQQLLRTVLGNDVRITVATSDLTIALDAFLEAYGCDGETDIPAYTKAQLRTVPKAQRRKS